MMGHKEKLKSVGEFDVLYNKQHYCYVEYSSKKIKKQMTRRNRRAYDIRNEVVE